MDKKTLMIIPTFNEVENISNLIEEIINLNLNIDILFIDDNSPDGTAKKIEYNINKYKKNITLVKRNGKLGLGSAYIIGYKYAIEKGYEYIIGMDADYSHDPKDIPRLIEKMSDFDLVTGSRYIGGIRVINWPLHRFILSISANFYYWILMILM